MDLSQQPYKQQALGNRVHAFTLARLLGLSDFAAPDQMNVTRFAIQVPFTCREEMTFYLAFECKRALEEYLPATRFLHDNKQLCVEEQATSRFMYNVANDVFKALESRVVSLLRPSLSACRAVFHCPPYPPQLLPRCY